jgi:transcriptional regulator
MYVPAHNALDDRPAQLDFIRNEPFGILVSAVDGKFFATHAPFVVLRDEPVRLGVHIAKANPQWQGLEHGADVLAIFHGPHAMISASWYQDPRHSVPTWNYSAVHCRGRATLADSAGTRRIIERLVAGLEHGWTIETADEEYIKRLEHAIVGIEIAVAEIFGKVKLGQTLSPENRERAAAFLSASSRAMDREVGQQMRTIRLPTKGDGK